VEAKKQFMTIMFIILIKYQTMSSSGDVQIEMLRKTFCIDLEIQDSNPHNYAKNPKLVVKLRFKSKLKLLAHNTPASTVVIFSDVLKEAL
jgi:hypothetical protein